MPFNSFFTSTTIIFHYPAHRLCFLTANSQRQPVFQLSPQKINANQLSVLILQFSLSKLEIDYMSTCCFQSDYFNVETDPHLSFVLQNQPQRKPSYDQLLIDLFPQQQIPESFPSSSETPKPRGRKPSTPSQTDKRNKKRRENTKTATQGQQKGHWYMDENKRYHWFLQIHSNHFLNKHLRRTDKIFKTMEIFVGTREAEQCRSHHQKMEKKHGNFFAILKELRMQNYGAGDAETVLSDMHANGVECSEELMPWSTLEFGIQQKMEEVESEKQTVNDSPQAVSEFIDPFLEIEVEKENLLEELML